MDCFTERHRDALTEVVNIGIGRAASILSSMSRAPVGLRVPELQLLPLDQVVEAIASRWRGKLVSVRMGFAGGFAGHTDLLFPSDSAASLVKAMIGDSGPDMDLDSLRIGTLTEVGNVVINGVLGSIGNILNENLEYTVPDTREELAEKLFAAPAGSTDDQPAAVLARTGFTVDDLELSGEIVIVFDVRSISSLVAAIDRILKAA